jgi:hypothetical protein
MKKFLFGFWARSSESKKVFRRQTGFIRPERQHFQHLL